MALDALLARLEGRAVTPVTADTIADVTPKPAPMLACTPVTSVTAENDGTAGKATSALLTAGDEAAIRAWLAQIKETDSEIIRHVLHQCRTDVDARDYFMRQCAEAHSPATIMMAGGEESSGTVDSPGSVNRRFTGLVNDLGVKG